MDAAKIKAISVLGYNFWIHVFKSLIPKDKEDQAELFREYFKEDRIAPFTLAEHEELKAFSSCVSCGLCPAHCRVMSLSDGAFPGPMRMALSTSRSHPDFIYDLDALCLCAVCGQCEPVCPEAVPVSRIASSMRRMAWRVSPESMPAAYLEARDNLEAHGNPYGREDGPALPRRDEADAVLILGPRLRLLPDKVSTIELCLAKLGAQVTGFEEGNAGGIVDALGLEADREWIGRLAESGQERIIVADPETWAALKNDPSLSQKKITFLLEEILERWPEDLHLVDTLEMPAAVHEPSVLARGAFPPEAIQRLFAKSRLEPANMSPCGTFSPPAGWEGGLELVAPELSIKVARERLFDAKEAGAKTIIALCPSDAAVLDKAWREGLPEAVYFMDAIYSALC